MVQCCVPFCKSTPGPSNNYSFHEFPVTKIRFEWLRRIARKGDGTGNQPWCPSDRSKVCSLHFREEDFRPDLKKRRLLPNAVPSIFPGYPAEMQKARSLPPPQKGRRNVLVTSSAAEELVARPRRGCKRKRLASDSLTDTDSTPLPGEISSALSSNVNTATSLTVTKRRSKRVGVSHQSTRSRTTHTKVEGGSEQVQELPTVSAATMQHIQISSSTSTPVSCTKKPVSDTPTLNLVVHSMKSLQKSPSVTSASSVDAAMSSCADGGFLVNSTQLGNRGVATATCTEASTVTASDSVPKTTVAAEIVADAPSNSEALVSNSGSLSPLSTETVSRDNSSKSDVNTSVALSSQATVVSVSKPSTCMTSRLAAEPGIHLLQLAKSSLATAPSSGKRKLVAVVPPGIKPEALKQFLIGSDLLSTTVVSGTTTSLTSSTVNASESNTVATCSFGTTVNSVRAVQSYVSKCAVNARRVVNVGKAVTQVVKQVNASEPACTSSLTTAGCMGKSRHTVTSHSTLGCCSKARRQLLIPNSPVTVSHPEVGSKLPLRRTVGSQTLLNRPRLQRLCQRLRTLQRKCLKLQTNKRHLQQELSAARQEARHAETIIKELRLTHFQEGVASGDARCLFLEEQLRCLGQTKHRWREETLQCCLMWNTLSPRGYRIISQSGLLSLPSCSTLKRHIGAIGDGTASLGEPPSPTGETLPSMEDIDDIHQLQDANVHLIDPSTDEISSDASEEHVHTDTDNTARADNENTAQDGCVRSASPDLQAERSQSLTEDAPSIAFPENGSKPNFIKGPQSKKKFLACQFAKPLAEDPTAEEGEQVLQVVYKKPSDILDENHGGDGKMQSTGDTTAATESSIDSNCGSCNNAKQADCPEPTAEFTAPSNWLSSAADKPADSVQIVTTEMKKKDAKRLATVRNKRLQSTVRSNVLCSKPSRPKPVSSKVRKDRSAAGSSGCLHRTSSFSSTASVTAAEKTEDYLSGHNLQLASPCKDLAELLNIVGAGTSNSTESAICAPSPVQGAAVSSGTERQLSLAETSSLDDAVELSVVPTVTSSSLDSDGVFPSDGVQVLKVICTEPSEGSVCEDFPEAVPKTTVVPSGEENQVFQIFYVCTPENLGASQ